MKMWMGIEKEGQYIGDKVLLVGSPTITAKEILEVENKYNSLDNIYFGAGGCTKPNYKVIRQVMNKSECTIILEVSVDKVRFVPKSILNDIDLIININTPWVNSLKGKLKEDYVTIKLEATGRNKGIVCLDICKVIWTKIHLLQGKKYKGDKVLK